MNILDVYKNLTLLRKADEIIEVRIPNSGYKGKDVYAGYFDDIDKCCKAVEKYNGVVPAIYTNLNPINPALLARANNRINEKAGLAAQDSDVIQRSWLYLDIDPVRPAGISSTDDEHNNAIAKAHQINRAQNHEGWGEGIVCDSGNGASLLFRIELSNNEVSTNLIKKVLSAFDFFYSDEKIQIDTSVFNAARIIKLYGTVTKKGDSITERPHRISAILSIPKNINPVSLEQLIDFASRVPEDPQIQAQPIYHNGTFDIQKWMQQHNITVSKKKGWNGGMLYVLDECPFDSNHKSPDACIIQGGSGAIGFRCLHNSCRNHDWKALRAFKEPTRIQTAGKEKKRDIGIEIITKQCKTKNDNPALILVNSPKVELPYIIDFSATTDLGNAKRFVQLHGQDIRYVPPWKCFLVWDGMRWVQKDERQMVSYVEKMIVSIREEAANVPGEERKDKLMKHAIATESENRIMACIRLAASQPEICVMPDTFDNDKYLLNFQNGTVDLHSGLMHEFKREDMITRICNVPYIKDAPCTIWTGFLNKIFAADKDVIEYIQKFIGMAYTGDISEELFHIFHGSGSNGKTTFLTAHNAILGKDYFKTMGVETLLKRGQKAIANDIARLQGARIVWANEPEYDDILTEGKIKKMVSKEKVLGEMKFKEPVEFEPEYSLIMSTNPKPRVRGTGKGWQRRVRFIPFDVEIKEEEKDIHFAEKLNTELIGIAAWAVDGAYKWQTEGLIPPEKILSATNEYHQDMDKFADLFNNIFINDPQAISPFLMLYTAYEAWATNEKIFIMSKNAFSRVLSDRGYKTKTARYSDGRQFKGFLGISVTHLLKKWVTDYLTAPDSEKKYFHDALLPVTHSLINPFNIETHVRTEINSNIGNISNSIAIIDNSELVTSVTSVTLNNENIIKILKEAVDKYNIQQLLEVYKTLENVKDALDQKILTEMPEREGREGKDNDKYIIDYFRARGWV